MAAEHLRNKRPSQDDKLAIKVQFLIAVKQGDLKRVERLLRDAPELAQTQTEWSPSSTTRLWPYGATALHWAAGTGDVELAKLLLAHGGDVNAGAPSRSGQTPLHEAVNMGQGELVQLLIEHGADVNASTGAGMTPLHNAALTQIHRRDDYAAAERAIGAREGDGPGTIWGRGGPVFVFSCRGETL